MGKVKLPVPKTVIIKARYLDSPVLENFFGSVFGHGNSTVRWKRGQYQCSIPRSLTEDELEGLGTMVELQHYQEI